MAVDFIRRRRGGARGGDARRAKQALLETLRHEGAEHREVALVFTDDAEIRALNRDFRGKDRPTDVLAFALDEAEDGALGGALGDVVVSVETAARQAEARRVDLDHELELLVVHGGLHLLGYDHDVPEAAKAMRAEIRRIRRRLAQRRASAAA